MIVGEETKGRKVVNCDLVSALFRIDRGIELKSNVSQSKGG